MGIARALGANRGGAPLALSLRAGEVLADVGAQAGIVPCEVLLIAYLRAATSPIGRGENAGRTIEEFNVVRSVRSLGRWNGQQQQFRARVQSLPHDATDVAVLVQPLGQGPVVGAAALALVPR